MPKYLATMVKGDPRDYPTQNITVFEPRPDGARERSRRVSHEFRQGMTREVSADLAKVLRQKTQPVTRGPKMFKIVVVDDAQDRAEPPAPTRPRPRRQGDDVDDRREDPPRRAPAPPPEPEDDGEDDGEDEAPAPPPAKPPAKAKAKPAEPKPPRPRPKKSDDQP